MRTTRDDVEYHVDKGVDRAELLRDMRERDSCSESCPHHDEADVLREVDAMVADGTLTEGRLGGHGAHYLVVTRFMPNTAAKMRAG